MCVCVCVCKYVYVCEYMFMNVCMCVCVKGQSSCPCRKALPYVLQNYFTGYETVVFLFTQFRNSCTH